MGNFIVTILGDIEEDPSQAAMHLRNFMVTRMDTEAAAVEAAIGHIERLSSDLEAKRARLILRGRLLRKPKFNFGDQVTFRGSSSIKHFIMGIDLSGEDITYRFEREDLGRRKEIDLERIIEKVGS